MNYHITNVLFEIISYFVNLCKLYVIYFAFLESDNPYIFNTGLCMNLQNTLTTNMQTNELYRNHMHGIDGHTYRYIPALNWTCSVRSVKYATYLCPAVHGTTQQSRLELPNLWHRINPCVNSTIPLFTNNLNDIYFPTQTEMLPGTSEVFFNESVKSISYFWTFGSPEYPSFDQNNSWSSVYTF